MFAAVWSSMGGARAILHLAEAGVVTLLISADVLQEIETAIREKVPEESLALLIDRCHIEQVPAPDPETIRVAETLTNYPADARILAAAMISNANYFVTLDKQHFLGNSVLRSSVSFPVGTPGDFLEWYRARLLEA